MRLWLACLTVLTITACGSDGTTGYTPVRNQVQKAAITGQNLYVANFGNSTVAVYGHGDAPVRIIRKGITLPTALAFDGLGNLYVANLGNNSVSVYAPGSDSPSRVVRAGVNYPTAIALDVIGNLYVADNVGTTKTPFGFLTVYAPGSSKPLRTITAQSLGNAAFEPFALAFDSLGNLYVSAVGNWLPHFVVQFAPGSSHPQQTIYSDLSIPLGLATDATNNLYVANYFGPKQHQSGAVSVFKPGATAAERLILNGTDGPVALAFDSSGELYVANFPYNYGLQCGGGGSQMVHRIQRALLKPHSGTDAGSVVVYGPTSPKPMTTLTKGISCPYALGFAGNALYVANQGNNSVTVYAPNGKAPVRTIRTGINVPYAMAFHQ